MKMATLFPRESVRMTWTSKPAVPRASKPTDRRRGSDRPIIRPALEVCGLEPAHESLQREIIAGLKRHPKTLPCKFLYDERGSRLFDAICELEEYYPTRTETRILRDNIGKIAALCGPHCLLVELGSGTSTKTRLLLDYLKAPVAYVPIDISRSHLIHAAEGLNGDYGALEILPVCADYSDPLTLPAPAKTPGRVVVFFPGSTIGNFAPREAAAFLRRIATWCHPGDAFLVGVDLQKDRQILLAAYNDAKGITSAFNLNLLRRANEELGANFICAQFRHRAIYNENHDRVEMHLVSRCKQRVTIAGNQIDFDKGEHIVTEYSYKYRIETFHQLASRAGWQPERTWVDENRLFSVNYLTLTKSP
jgi:dimethylhistidine N-methyltransferase